MCYWYNITPSTCLEILDLNELSTGGSEDPTVGCQFCILFRLLDKLESNVNMPFEILGILEIIEEIFEDMVDSFNDLHGMVFFFATTPNM